MWRIMVHYKETDWENLEELLGGSGYPWYRSGDRSVIVYVPDGDVEEFITRLEEALDMRYRENLIEADKPHIVSSGPAKRMLHQRDPLSLTTVDEMLSKALEYSSRDPWRLALAIIAALITLAGLWIDSATVIIGAMLVSPLLAPLYAFSVSTIAGNRRMLRDSVVNLVLLMSITYASILSISVTLKLLGYTAPLTGEVRQRITLDPLYAVIALLLGSAAMLSIRREVTEAIAGIAIAAALLPPLTTSALLLPYSMWDSVRALLVTLYNIIGLSAGSITTLVLLGIRPRRGKGYIYRAVSVTLILLLILAFLVIYPPG